MSKVEAVARALARHDNPKHENWWPSYESRARAAIEAMREPTEAMVDSCGNGECAKWARGAWANYIDAALNEEG